MVAITQSNIIVTLNGGSPAIPGYWATYEGGALTRERENSYDGGAGYHILLGRPTAEDITITRTYDPARDDTWLNQLRRNIMAGERCEYNVTKQRITPSVNWVHTGTPEVHPNCPVLTVRTTPITHGPEATAATIELVLATKGPRN
jgi:hypothetical protein